MSDQQSRQDDQPEPQDNQPEPQNGQLAPRRHNRWIGVPPRTVLLFQLSVAVVQLGAHLLLEQLIPRYIRTPYHTSSLSGASWVNELLTGHPERIRNELGVYRGTFTILIKAIERAGVQSSRHVSIEEQLAIFLYTAVTGMTCTHVGERFQRSSSTITK